MENDVYYDDGRETDWSLKYKWDDYDSIMIEKEIDKILIKLNPICSYTSNSYHNNTKTISKLKYNELKESREPLWRTPYVSSHMSFKDEYVEIEIEQEEYCISTCEKEDGRCEYPSAKTQYIARITYDEIKPYVTKQNKYIVRHMAEEAPDKLSKIINKTEDYIYEWVCKENDKEYGLINK